MSTTPCSGCGKYVGDNAIICPNCGQRSPAVDDGSNNLACGCIGIPLGLFWLVCIVGAAWKDSPALVILAGVAIVGSVLWFLCKPKPKEPKK